MIKKLDNIHRSVSKITSLIRNIRVDCDQNKLKSLQKYVPIIATRKLICDQELNGSKIKKEETKSTIRVEAFYGHWEVNFSPPLMIGWYIFDAKWLVQMFPKDLINCNLTLLYVLAYWQLKILIHQWMPSKWRQIAGWKNKQHNYLVGSFTIINMRSFWKGNALNLSIHIDFDGACYFYHKLLYKVYILGANHSIFSNHSGIILKFYNVKWWNMR